MIWIRPNGKLPWLPQCYFGVGDIHAKGSSERGQTGTAFPPCYQANQSQFNFEILIATETNYRQYDLNP